MRYLTTFLILVISVAVVWATGTATITETRDLQGNAVIICKCTAPASGTAIAEATTTNSYTGKIVMLYNSVGTGAKVPTNNWDVEVFNANRGDVLLGNGYNVTNAMSSYVPSASLGAVIRSRLTFRVSYFGNSKEVTSTIYIAPF